MSMTAAWQKLQRQQTQNEHWKHNLHKTSHKYCIQFHYKRR